MKKIASFCVIIVFSLSYLFFLSTNVFAQTDVSLRASVGKYNFTLSGFVSPFASIVMSQDSFYMSSGVANKEGFFALDPALVNEGFTNFCLEAIDVKRIGTSFTCFEIEAIKQDFYKSDIFLPPTVGLSGRKITPNSSIFASGFSMPFSLVKVSLDDNKYIEATTDSRGYYKTEVKKLPPGEYVLFATSTYENQYSQIPTRKFTIESVGYLEGVPGWLWILLFLLLIFIAIMLFIILMKRRKKNKDKKTNRLRGSSS